MIFRKKRIRKALIIMHKELHNYDHIMSLCVFAARLCFDEKLSKKQCKAVSAHFRKEFPVNVLYWPKHLKAGREHWLWYQIRDLTPWYKESEGADRELPTTSLPRVLLFWGIAIPLVILCTYLFVNYNGQ